jgi:hypothetical protein
MTTELLENFSRLCDEVEEFMRDENTDLRCSGTDGSGWVERKKLIIARVDALLQQMRAVASQDVLNPGPIREMRDHVMKRLLKLLLLSRENEQLLLKNSLPHLSMPASRPVTPGSIRQVYQNAK